MEYWDSVLQEVADKNEEHVQFRFTDIGRNLLRKRRYGEVHHRKHKTPAYYLGEEYGDLYFTQREVEALHYLLQGKTIAQVGHVLGLSARTIEFYLKNMKLKVGVKTKVELLEIVQQSPLANELETIVGVKHDAS